MGQQRCNSSRHTDEVTLAWVRLRASGVTCGVIGKRYGVAPSRVRTATNRVLEADLAESGEAQAASAYWGH